MRVSVEIAFLILSNLEKEDLLNCRLVSRSWDSECRSILNTPTRNYRQILDNQNIEDFVEYAATSNYNNPILPYHLKIDKDNESVFDNLDALINLHGQECVHTLTVGKDFYGLTNVKELLKVLAKVSRGLRSLLVRFSSHVTEIDCDGETLSNLLTKYKYTFPKLQVFKCETNNHLFGFDIIYRSLIEGCTNLYHLLLVDINTEFMETVFPYEQLKSLEVGEFDHSEDGLLMETLRQTPPSNSSLAVYCVDDHPFAEDVHSSFTAFLSYFCNLTSLTIPLPDDDEIRGEIYRIPFLPNVKHLRIYMEGCTYFLNTTEMDLKPSALPSLESIRVPTTCYFVESTTFPPDVSTGTIQCVKSQVEFPNVKHLILDVMCEKDARREFPCKLWKSNEGEDHEDMTRQANVVHLLTMFSSTTKITLIRMTHAGSGVRKVLENLLITPLAQGVKDLDILNVTGTEDYLGDLGKRVELLVRRNTPSFLTNVERIRLLLPSSDTIYDLFTQCNFDPNEIEILKLDLCSLSRHMPGLYKIGTPFKLLGEDKASRRMELQRLRDTYPHINFDLSYAVTSEI